MITNCASQAQSKVRLCHHLPLDRWFGPEWPQIFAYLVGKAILGVFLTGLFVNCDPVRRATHRRQIDLGHGGNSHINAQMSPRTIRSVACPPIRCNWVEMTKASRTRLWLFPCFQCQDESDAVDVALYPPTGSYCGPIHDHRGEVITCGGEYCWDLMNYARRSNGNTE